MQHDQILVPVSASGRTRTRPPPSWFRANPWLTVFIVFGILAVFGSIILSVWTAYNRIQGLQGIAGTNGTTGINGINGINGANGTNGVNYTQLLQFGVVTLNVNGSAVVVDTLIKNGTVIIVTPQPGIQPVGIVFPVSITNGVGFILASKAGAGDANVTVGYLVISSP